MNVYGDAWGQVYPVMEVHPHWATRPEQMDSKDKFWFQDPNDPHECDWLFKFSYREYRPALGGESGLRDCSQDAYPRTESRVRKAHAPGDYQARVVKLNPVPAPSMQRVLIELSGHWPHDHEPMSADEFQLLRKV